MRLRLFRRSTSDEIVVGRHSVPRVGPTVPGAAATLVAAAASWDHASDRVPVPVPVVVVDESTAPARAPAGMSDVEQAAPEGLVGPAEASISVHPDWGPAPVPAPVLVSTGVSLGFADGAQVHLPADDPRVRTFHAAAAALLEPPRT